MGSVTIKQGGATTIVLSRATVANIQAMPRDVNVAATPSAQVIEKSATVTPIARPTNVEVGKMGLQGPKGDPGASGDKTFDYAQPTSSASWTIAHGLGKYPSVSVVDSAGSQIFGSVKYLDLNTVRIDFSLPFSGSAFLN